MIFTLSVVMALVALVGGCSSTPSLSSIEVTPATTSIAVGASQQFTATGKYSDDSTKDISADVTWSSSDPTIVTISKEGLASGVAKGSATIKASLDDVVGSVTLKVDAPENLIKSIAVTPAAPSIAKGTTVELTATGTFMDGTTKDVTATATWKSATVSVATVDGKGVVTGVDAGSSVITATLDGVSGSATVGITSATLGMIQVTATEGWAAKGTHEQFTAVGIFSDETKQDLTKQVVWASSSPAVTISNLEGSKGLATAANEGMAVITATTMGVTGATVFVVTPATLDSITVTPFNPTIAKGTTVAFTATGVFSDQSYMDLTAYVAWKSSNDAVAKFAGNAFAPSVAQGVDVGTVTISASYKGVSGATYLMVTSAGLTKVSLVPLNPSIAKGTSMMFKAIGTFSDKTAQDLTSLATFGSSDPSVATVSNTSWSHGFAQGTTTITATVGGKSDTTVLTVTPATLASISITPAAPVLAKGTSLQLTATGIYSDKTTQDLTDLAVWSSTDPSVVVSNGEGSVGVITGAGQGTAMVKATYGGVTGGTFVTVTSATLTKIEVTPANPVIPKGTSIFMYATGIYSDDTTQDLTHWVTWSSSDASVAISNSFVAHGQAIGQVEGSAVVTATFPGGKSGSTTITVSAATLSKLAIEPDSPSIAKGTNIALRLVATYTDMSTQSVGWNASWSSEDESIVTVGNGVWFGGIALGVNQGAAKVTATYGGQSTFTTVTVTGAVLTSLGVGQFAPSMAKGTAQQLKVMANYTDGTQQDVTTDATWVSSDEAKAIVSNAVGSKGLVTAVSPGSVSITANFGGKNVNANLTITAATLASITVSPMNGSVAKNATLQFWALGTFTDNTVQDVTQMVTWASSDGTKAIISNAVGSKGLATGVAPGITTISALGAGKAGSTQLTVTP
jgi:uncharacterized protein YjdB